MKYNLSNSEQRIMRILWTKQQWVTISDMMKILEPEGILWKRQTINTFLSRLIKKGLVIQNSRKYIFAYTEEEYKGLKAKELLNDYGGSLMNFVTALSGNNEIPTNEVEQLQKYLETCKVGN